MSKSIVHFEFIPQGQTVNQAYYVEILKKLCESVYRRKPELWPGDEFTSMTMLQLTRCCQSFSGPKIDY
jgi:hypothetical protein